MIEIEAVLDENEILRSCKAGGHAGKGQTGDIVCAAVSVLMRTAACTLSDREGIIVRFEAPEPGLFFLEAEYEAEGRDFLFASGVFLIEGLASVAEEYPNNCRLTIRRT
ncbi:MAG: ribosomal-processing cysteine protease Prp [Treponema sp.]|nr:ribosomal-processing cysteine protease Prp [Treponema sp.]